jgi:2-polyprenyl-6-methoxyphenol hydroxylase-like FAD-dependent oxidoreductase
MKLTNTEVLISGASVAGPTLAWWLCRQGLSVTVVEQTPALRAGLGGHAVDLFGPAVEVAEWMGILPKVLAARTRTDQVTIEHPGKPPVQVDLSRLVAGISERHVEIMRGELTSILYQATRDDVEYRFGDWIRTLDQDGDGVQVSFERSPPRRFDLVVGADGLHSGVRRLVFGDEAPYRHWLGGYLGVFSLPNYRGLEGRMVAYSAPDRTAAMYPVRQTGQARALLLFRSTQELHYDHRDLEAQRRLLAEAFADDAWEVPRLPVPLQRRLSAFQGRPARALEAVTLEKYEP